MNSLTIVIPCLNEGENIQITVQNFIAALRDRIDDYEIIIFNDASTDDTQTKIEHLAQRFPKVSAIELKQHCGVGRIFLKGLELAQKTHLTILPGDNEIPKSSLETLFEAVGSAELIITYVANPQVRPWYRRVASQGFTWLMNLATRNSLRYYNGPAIYKVETLRRMNISYTAFGFLAEILVRLLKEKVRLREIPFELSPRRGSSRQLNLKGVLGGLRTVWRSV